MNSDHNFRKLNQKEKEILNALLTKSFKGKEEIESQIQNSLVRTIREYKDNWGSIEFKTLSERKADVESRIPVQGITYDVDKTPIEIYLHVIDGLIEELEIVRADNKPIIKLVPEEIIVITYNDISKNN